MTHRTKRVLHYWICLPGTVFFVFWILSGVILVWDSIRGGLHAFPVQKNGGDVHSFGTSAEKILNPIPQPVNKYSAFFIGEHPYIQAVTQKETVLLDPLSGRILSPLQESSAREILAAYAGAAPVYVKRVIHRSYEYKYGSLPAWRGEFSDGRIIHISEQSGDPQSWSDRTGMMVRAMYYYGHSFQITDSNAWNAVIGFFAILWAAGSVISGLLLYARRIKVALLLLAVLVPCHDSSAATDMIGREVTLKRTPQRIVSLAPSCTEIIAALGLQDKLVGITEHTDYPPEVLDLSKVGSYVNLNIETIAFLRPDLIIATEDGNPEEVIRRLEKLSIPIFVLRLRTYEEIQESLLTLGKYLGRESQAESSVKVMRQTASCISEKTRNAKRPSVLWIYDTNPIVTAGRNTFTNELIKMAGGNSITEDVSIPYPRLTIENVIARNPGVIILTSMNPSLDRQEKEKWWSQWPMIQAVRTKHVYVMESKNLDRPSPRIVFGFLRLAKTFHPEIFQQNVCSGVKE
jgi:cobalamin transport system substrate-binding protein